MREIPLTRGMVALVDDADYEVVAGFSWWAQTNGSIWYARATVSSIGRRNKHKLMHRLLIDVPKGMVVDHVNRNGLDNRRSNLRVCTLSENLRNQNPHRGKFSQFKGVGWHKCARRWTANITPPGGKQTRLGYFSSEIEAAVAYDAAASFYFGEFARLNLQYERRTA